MIHDALARHHEIVRDAIASHDGCVVKTTGGGFHTAVATVRDALGAALSAHQMMAAEPPVRGVSVKARMGCTPARCMWRTDNVRQGDSLEEAPCRFDVL